MILYKKRIRAHTKYYFMLKIVKTGKLLLCNTTPVSGGANVQNLITQSTFKCAYQTGTDCDFWTPCDSHVTDTKLCSVVMTSS